MCCFRGGDNYKRFWGMVMSETQIAGEDTGDRSFS